MSNFGHGADSNGTPQPDGISVTGKASMARRRMFIGPMPEKVIAHTEATQHKRTQLTLGSVFSLTQEPLDNVHNPDKIREVSRVFKENAFHFFVHEGGKAEDWNEEEEEHITDQLAKRWKSSEWGQLWNRRHHNRKKEAQSAGGHRWFGTSFEVGTLMGVNLHGQEHAINLSARSNSSRDVVDNGSSHPFEARNPQFQDFSSGAPSTSQVNGNSPKSFPSVETTMETPMSSRTGLLRPQRSDTMLPKRKSLSPSNDQMVASQYIRPAMSTRTSAINDGRLSSNAKGKAKAVRYSENPSPRVSSPSPVPPEEVLKRSSIDAKSGLPTGITAPGLTWGEVILRGIYHFFKFSYIH